MAKAGAGSAAPPPPKPAPPPPPPVQAPSPVTSGQDAQRGAATALFSEINKAGTNISAGVLHTINALVLAKIDIKN